MKPTFLHFLMSIVLLSFFSCSEDVDTSYEEVSFTKIYDDNIFDNAYHPIDLQQTADGGYLILCNRKLADSEFAGIYLLKTAKNGEFIKAIEVDPTYVHPVGGLIPSQGSYYFFCMNSATLASQLVKVEASGETLEVSSFTEVGGGSGVYSYPTAAAKDGENFMLLNYDHDGKKSVLSIVNAAGGVLAGASVDIGVGDDVDEPIINHFLQTGRKFPFSVGRIPGSTYFFNGFHNYTFSMVFVNLNDDDNPVMGAVQGQQENGGFSAIYPIAGNKFAAARFNFGDNFLLPNVTLSSSGFTTATDLGGYILPNLVPDAKVQIIHSVIKQKGVLIYGSDTKSKQIGLLFYDEASGEFYGSQHLGFSNPFELGGMVQTSDGGLAVCGTTYVAGRFPRVCLFKLSKAKLEQKVK